MSAFDIRADAPGLLRTESLHISVKFDRTSETTGRVSWNIPMPAAGCSADNQAYCGIIVTLDTKPVSSTALPQDGTVYSSDPTASTNLHAGDKLGTAMVIGAFYNDRATTFFDVTGLLPNTPYYVSAFPSDCQFRYYREGVHAYSLDFKQTGTADTASTQVVILNEGSDPSGVQLIDSTGLQAGQDYDFKIHLGVEPAPNRPLRDQECALVPPSYTITVNGSVAQTYDDLIKEINRKFALIDGPTQSAVPPSAGTYVITGTPPALYVWDGFTHVAQEMLVQSTDPSAVVDGTYWYNPVTSALKVRNGVNWDTVTYIGYSTDPTAPICDTSVWLANNSTQAYRWNGTTWCSEVLINQSTDPSLVTVPCGAYWYNIDTEYLYSWNDDQHKWVSVDAIQSTVDPTTLVVGSYWFNETDHKLYMLGAGGWSLVSSVQYTATAPTVVVSNMVWFNTQTFELNIRNGGNTAWVSTAVISYPTDPRFPASCELWWEQIAANNITLHMWNASSSAWVTVTKFYEQSTDPSLPPTISQGTVWIDSNGIVYQWENNCFVPITPLTTNTDPTQLGDGTIWFDSTNHVFRIRQAGAWVLLAITTSGVDPAAMPAGTFWYNSPTLQRWNGAAWVVLSYNSAFVSPAVGTLWYNTTVNATYQWDGNQWVEYTHQARVELNCYNNLIFTHTKTGSLSFVRLEDITLFAALTATFRFDVTVPGIDGVSDIPSYAEDGIGTDVSADERNKLANEIRYALGYPVVDVEVAPEQIDLAITMAISELRARTSVAYTHGYFFMRTTGENQRYLLTNKIQGMHKIATVLSVQRITSAFLSSAHGAGVYGQIILQHLYNMGNFDILSYHLMAEYVKTLEIMFAGRLTFNWDEHKRELFIHNRMPFSEQVVMIEAMVDRSEQDIMNDRWTKEWIRRFATAKVKEMLSGIRGKFSTLPGAGGSVTLNASDLKMQAEAEIAACLQEIDDFIVDRPETIGYTSSFVFG